MISLEVDWFSNMGGQTTWNKQFDLGVRTTYSTEKFNLTGLAASKKKGR